MGHREMMESTKLYRYSYPIFTRTRAESAADEKRNRNRGSPSRLALKVKKTTITQHGRKFIIPWICRIAPLVRDGSTQLI